MVPSPPRQRLLVDTDVFCKLFVAGLFADAIAVLGVSIQECGRLPALPYMLRRGRMRQILGGDVSDELAFHAEGMPVAMEPSQSWLEPLVEVESIDAGEAQLLATCAEHRLFLLTADKRGLLGLSTVAGYPQALSGRIIILEAILAELCVKVGENEIRSRIQPMVTMDVAVKNCFSNSEESPLVGLISYYDDLAANVEPLQLWRPSRAEQP